MIINILVWCVFGLFAGALARLLVPGRDPMGCLGTMALGIVGSFFGGFLFQFLFSRNTDGIEPAGILGSILGAILVLLILRQVSGKRIE